MRDYLLEGFREVGCGGIGREEVAEELGCGPKLESDTSLCILRHCYWRHTRNSNK